MAKQSAYMFQHKNFEPWSSYGKCVFESNLLRTLSAWLELPKQTKKNQTNKKRPELWLSGMRACSDIKKLSRCGNMRNVGLSLFPFTCLPVLSH